MADGDGWLWCFLFRFFFGLGPKQPAGGFTISFVPVLWIAFNRCRQAAVATRQVHADIPIISEGIFTVENELT